MPRLLVVVLKNLSLVRISLTLACGIDPILLWCAHVFPRTLQSDDVALAAAQDGRLCYFHPLPKMVMPRCLVYKLQGQAWSSLGDIDGIEVNSTDVVNSAVLVEC